MAGIGASMLTSEGVPVTPGLVTCRVAAEPGDEAREGLLMIDKCDAEVVHGELVERQEELRPVDMIGHQDLSQLEGRGEYEVGTGQLEIDATWAGEGEDYIVFGQAVGVYGKERKCR
ncbi:hypothetical protein N7G274_001826 [Stereocaulon virgatum]|uniref:Uncharacterized protein n=1 Tax=Stereocaulon virgatum TaxID=373712 RepID=A0ABR4AKU4_9LECA